jgi:hypothetical protein
MHLRYLFGAAALVVASALQTSAMAAPPGAASEGGAGIDLTQVQADCHADVRRHRLPGMGVVEHFHRGARCNAIIVEDEEEELDDCHANAQAHPLAGYGRRPILHRHRGSSCRVVILDEEEDDCHRQPQQHRLRGLGNIWHRHVGPSCRVEELEVYRPGQSTQGCIQVGPVRVCP